MKELVVEVLREDEVVAALVVVTIGGWVTIKGG
mgnify:CR=1 FL=1